ncbi:MAG TPA: hypothetical protein VE174_04835 [Actinomycetota bacterium]|nr:hypothetical protein [Actinomycetota bacterium]
MLKKRAALGEDGFQLVELMVAMVVAMISTGLLIYATTSVYRTQRFGSQDSDALASLRASNDRVVRELRQAVVVYTSSTTTSLQAWVDNDADQVLDAGERITWTVTNSSGTKAQLSRTTNAVGAPTTVIARDLSWSATQPYFAYNASYSLVTITLIADADSTVLAPQRTIRTQVRLRNATPI